MYKLIRTLIIRFLSYPESLHRQMTREEYQRQKAQNPTLGSFL